MTEQIPKDTADQNIEEIIGLIGKDWKHGERLGGGGFGTVYTVHPLKEHSKIQYVVKEIILDVNAPSEKYLNSFLTETEILKTIGSHKRIVPFIGASTYKNTLLIFMRYMKQGSLRKYSESKQGLREWEASIFTKQILEGLNYLHKRKIIHRDIKGDNVLMQDERHIRLADFGISKTLQDVSSTSTSGVGTTRWMAPEIMDVECQNLKHNEKADIWSLGCTVIEMITAKSPFMEFQEHQKNITKTRKNRPTALDLLKNDNFVAGPTRNVVLIGRSNGKTSCRDTLMGRYLKKTTVSSTRDFDCDDIQVFVMPSVDDMCIYEEMVQFYETAIEVMNTATEGVTAFLLVLRYGKLYTKQDHDLILSLKDFFGDDFLRKYCIVLFTHGDIFIDDHTCFTFKEWCDWQDGYLELLYKACNKRFVLMFNSSDDNTKHKCRNEVFKLVYKLSRQQEPYTLTDFKNHQTAREQCLVYMPSTDKIKVIQLVFISYCQDAEKIMKDNNWKGFEEMTTKSQYFKDRISVERENFNRSTANGDVLKKEMHEEINRELDKLEISFTNVDNTIRSIFASEISCTDAEIVIKALRKEFKCDSTEDPEGIFPKIKNITIGQVLQQMFSSAIQTQTEEFN